MAPGNREKTPGKLAAAWSRSAWQYSTATPSAQVEQQAIESLLARYREAVLAEDIDRLQALLQPTPALVQPAAQRTARQAFDGTFADLATFRQALSDTFRTHTLLALELPAAEVVIAPDRGSVTFLEVESTLAPASLTQATRVFRTTWQLARREADGVVTVGIAAVTRQGPLVEITTPGQVQAGALRRVQITGAMDFFPLASAVLEEPATGVVQTLRSSADSFHGAFVASRLASPQSLTIRLRSDAGQELVVPHHYGVRGAGEGVVQRVAETETTRFFAVTVAMASSISSMSSRPTLRKPRTAMATGWVTTPTRMTITTDLPMPKKPQPRPRPMREIRYRFRLEPHHRG